MLFFFKFEGFQRFCYTLRILKDFEGFIRDF